MINKTYKDALILAGGRGRRMGGFNKALLQYDNVTFLEKLIATLDDFSNIYVSLNKEQSFSVEGATTIFDTYHDIGPLAGIYEGLKVAKENNHLEIFLTPCDCPNLDKDLIKYIYTNLSEVHDAIIIKDNDGNLHPLLGIYKTSILPIVLNSILSKDFKVRNLFNKINVKHLSLKDTNFDHIKILKNINTHKDYKELINK